MRSAFLFGKKKASINLLRATDVKNVSSSSEPYFRKEMGFFPSRVNKRLTVDLASFFDY